MCHAQTYPPSFVTLMPPVAKNINLQLVQIDIGGIDGVITVANETRPCNQ